MEAEGYFVSQGHQVAHPIKKKTFLDSSSTSADRARAPSGTSLETSVSSSVLFGKNKRVAHTPKVVSHLLFCLAFPLFFLQLMPNA